jgi:hypothetical protein
MKSYSFVDNLGYFYTPQVYEDGNQLVTRSKVSNLLFQSLHVVIAQTG